jgi:5'(3')-deoxyribonucleotidase
MSLAGKLTWLQRFTGERNFRDYIFTTHKHLLACECAILVDDRESNILEFEGAGGGVVLFPQPWNSATLAPDVTEVDYVVQQIMELQHE